MCELDVQIRQLGTQTVALIISRYLFLPLVFGFLSFLINLQLTISIFLSTIEAVFVFIKPECIHRNVHGWKTDTGRFKAELLIYVQFTLELHV